MKMKGSILVVISVSMVIICALMVEIGDAYNNSSPLSPSPSPHHHHLISKPPLQAPPGAPSFCVPKCNHRCSRNPRELCKKLCMKCCAKCKCVPTGPYGDKKECPCYRDWFTKEGKPKCP